MRRILGILLSAILLLAVTPAFAQDEESNTIADIVIASAGAEEPEFSTLLAAVQAADPSIVEALANPEAELTVFAPTDAAFTALAEALGEEAFTEILTEEGTPRLNEILLYHVVEGIVPSSAVVEALTAAEADDMGSVSVPVATLSGQALDITGTLAEAEDDMDAALDLEAGITVDGANLVLEMVDIEADNGIIHVIDAVLVPELRTVAEIVTELASAEEDAQFTTLLTAVGAADPAVLELVADPTAEFTIFAPTDAAFLAVEGLDGIVADTALLTQILQYHVFPGTVYSWQIGDLVDEEGNANITMADGSEATISVTDEGVFINDAMIVLEAVDIEASNGVIHVIDAVIVPPME